MTDLLRLRDLTRVLRRSGVLDRELPDFSDLFDFMYFRLLFFLSLRLDLDRERNESAYFVFLLRFELRDLTLFSDFLRFRLVDFYFVPHSVQAQLFPLFPLLPLLIDDIERMVSRLMVASFLSDLEDFNTPVVRLLCGVSSL